MDLGRQTLLLGALRLDVTDLGCHNENLLLDPMNIGTSLHKLSQNPLVAHALNGIKYFLLDCEPLNANVSCKQFFCIHLPCTILFPELQNLYLGSLNWRFAFVVASRDC